MIEQMRKLTHIYDLLALCCSYILKEVPDSSYDFATFNDDNYDLIYDAIETYCNEKIDKGSKIAFERLRKFVSDFFASGINIEKCFAVVKYIDDLVEVRITDRLLGAKGIIPYVSLNSQFTDCVRIIPKVKNTFLSKGDFQFKTITHSEYSLLRKRRECACSILDAETVNYMIWDSDKIKEYPVTVYHIDNKHPIAKHFYNREKIVLGIIPFTCKRFDEILKINYVESTFFIDGMFELAEDELKARYKSIYERYCNEDIDFLVYPEMLMTNEMICSIPVREELSGPQIMVNGSIWENRTNTTVVTDGKGKKIFSYSKKEPYQFESEGKKYKEHLDRTKNKEYTILEIDGIGRIGISICKDIANQKVKLFHKYIGTNLLIVPAYTKSMDLKSSAEELSAEFNCVVVVANACSALAEKSVDEKKIGFISIPAKKGNSRSVVTKIYCMDKCLNDCMCKCDGKVISIEFCKTASYEEGISYLMYELQI